MDGPTKLVRVWDAPIRVFHWMIVLLVGFSWLSMEYNWIDLHFLSGYAILALLLFRIVWGIVGSDTARFSRFLSRRWRRCGTSRISAGASRTGRSATMPPAAGWCC